ncbi:Rieske 2Fe-2S domain-containing protein [Streptomyces gamaensis]|uniref:Rieske 2Fe-2S domain-containing protein n=1 Tax=Streptomyces gamaensis TaxID=1763542 RepID=A0ABW0YV52_9ACTN
MIPNQWYPILETKEVGNDKPVGVRRMGENLVLWRDLDGNLVCQGARCPHKGANLGDGRMKGNTIECPYHGLRYGTDGACKAIPALGTGARIPASLRVPVHPVREAHGLVWLWWGDQRAELPDVQIAPEVADNPLLHWTMHWPRPVHYTRYIESVLEFYHITFVHRDHWFNYIDYALLYGTPRKFGLDGRERYLSATKVANSRFETDGQTLRYSFDGQDENDPANSSHYDVTFTFPCQVHIKNDQFEVTSWLSPIDEHNTEHILRWYEYPNAKPFLRSPSLRLLLPRLSLYMEKWIQDIQDVRVMEGQEPKVTGRGVNKFIQVDELNAKYVAMRDRLIQEARAGAAAPAAAERTPVAPSAAGVPGVLPGGRAAAPAEPKPRRGGGKGTAVTAVRKTG